MAANGPVVEPGAALAEFRLTPLSVAVTHAVKLARSSMHAAARAHAGTDAAEIVSQREDHEPFCGTEKRS